MRARAYAVGVLLAICCIATSGCGDDDDSQPTPAATATLTPTPTPTPAARFQGVGLLSDGSTASTTAFGISGDGTTVVGSATTDTALEAFRWTAGGGIEGLGFPAERVNSEALVANLDGSVVAGDASEFGKTGLGAARWSTAEGWTLLPSVTDGFPTQARGISANGKIIVGRLQDTSSGAPRLQAFRWTAEAGTELLGYIDGNETLATGLSADGTAASVLEYLQSGDLQAVRWTLADGYSPLPMLANHVTCSPYGISADGTTIVGSCGPTDDPEAVLWDERGAVGLGTLPNGIGSFLLAVSADGSVGVGQAGNDQGIIHAALWTPEKGLQDLREVLIGLGLETELAGWTLLSGNAISSDGRVIAGYGTDPQGHCQGFVAVLP